MCAARSVLSVAMVMASVSPAAPDGRGSVPRAAPRLALRGGAPAPSSRKSARPASAASDKRAATPALADRDHMADDDAEAGKMPYYPPGSLPDWAQEIAEWRNMTMAEKLAKVEQRHAEAGTNPEELFAEGYAHKHSRRGGH